MYSFILVQQVAARVKHDPLAAKLLQNGNRFGRQHIVFQTRHSYPAYVVKYTLDADVAKLPVVKVQSSLKSIRVSVANETVYNSNLYIHNTAWKDSLVFVSVNFRTLDCGKVNIFNIREQSVEESMTAYLSSLKPDEIVLVAAAKLPAQSEFSRIMTNVLPSLRSIGGSMHVLDCPYVLVGSKQPHLLAGLVHEDHQPTKAAVEVDVRVIRYNHDRPIPTVLQSHSDTHEDMTPVRWQQQDNRNPNGVAWQDLRNVGPRLTAAYQTGQRYVPINRHAVDLGRMKVRGGPKIRCLNLKGEILAPLPRDLTGGILSPTGGILSPLLSPKSPSENDAHKQYSHSATF